MLGEFHTASLVLCGHLAFAALPGMELVGIEFLHGFLVATQLVEQGNLFQHEVVALLNQLGVFL